MCHLHGALLVQSLDGCNGGTPCRELDESAALRRPVRIAHAVDLSPIAVVFAIAITVTVTTTVAITITITRGLGLGLPWTGRHVRRQTASAERPFVVKDVEWSGVE